MRGVLGLPNISAADMATTGAHLIAIVAAAFVVRGRLVEVAARLIEVGARLAEIAAQWAKNREVGQQRDKLWETLGEKIDENTRETRQGFERQEQRFNIQDALISALRADLAETKSILAAALVRISALEAKP